LSKVKISSLDYDFDLFILKSTFVASSSLEVVQSFPKISILLYANFPSNLPSGEDLISGVSYLIFF